MIDFNRVIELIRRNGGFKPNRNDSSYYRTYTIEGNRPLQARVSNHGTWLWTWYDKQYDPSKNQGTVPRHHDEWSGLLINIICRHNVHMWIVCQHEFLSQRFGKPIDVSL